MAADLEAPKGGRRHRRRPASNGFSASQDNLGGKR